MSDNWGADQIPPQRGVRPSSQDIVATLANAQDMPLDALEAAILYPDTIVEPVLATLARASVGDELDRPARNLLFWGLHVLAQQRETRVAAPLLALLRRTDEASLTLNSELAVGALPKIVVSTFDDDVGALEGALADPQGDEFSRWGLFGAYAFLVFDERITKERAHAFLVRFDDERLGRAGDLSWSGWEDAVGLLGFADLTDRRNAAVADARILSTHDTDDEFAAFAEMARTDFDDPTRFAVQGVGYMGDAIAELEAALEEVEDDGEPITPVQNPLRHVGRNDPCPCGSGKKYKKCCLDTDAS